MGQYYKIVNLDKQEYVHPHQIGCGLKAWELGANPQLAWVLSMLLVNSPQCRGGGDFRPTVEGVIGRWAGDRIVLVGDYAEPGDAGIADIEFIYELCSAPSDRQHQIDYLRNELNQPEQADRLAALPSYRDISELIRPEIEAQFDVTYQGDIGWGKWVDKHPAGPNVTNIRPDMVL